MKKENKQSSEQKKTKKKRPVILHSWIGVLLLAGLVALAVTQSAEAPGTCEDDTDWSQVDKKPVIYLYPETETDVQVKLNYKGELTTTYPKYNDGWSVTARPDGSLTNHADGKNYSYLFWEGVAEAQYDFSKGFCVKKEDALTFLQTILLEIGLNEKEYNEFIVYWLPELEKNDYNLVSFQFEEYTNHAELNITPTPDSVLRVFMAVKPVEFYKEIPAQTFDKFERKGFTVVEWGGALIKD